MQILKYRRNLYPYVYNETITLNLKLKSNPIILHYTLASSLKTAINFSLKY